MFKRFHYYFLYILPLGLIIGCASTKKNIETDLPAAQNQQMDESFDPLMLNEDDINFQKISTNSNNEMESPVDRPAVETGEIENKLIDGYRIQILSTKDLENATTAKQMAGERMLSLNIQTYLDFDSPYYKIRIGDFIDREAAEDALGIVRASGYSTAWIVPSKVWSNP